MFELSVTSPSDSFTLSNAHFTGCTSATPNTAIEIVVNALPSSYALKNLAYTEKESDTDDIALIHITSAVDITHFLNSTVIMTDFLRGCRYMCQG